MLDQKNLVQLAIAAASAKGSTMYSFNDEKFSCSELNDTLRKELNELAGSHAAYRENKNLIFSLIEQTVDTVLPKRVAEKYLSFADTVTVPQGDKAIFKQKITSFARQRAKGFVSRVGLAGVYEVFKLDGSSFEVPTGAIGGAAQVGIEEFLDGRWDMSDFLEIVLEGLDDAIYKEIQTALLAAVGQVGSNVENETGFVETAMDNLLMKADAYGKAVIYCMPEFAAKIKPDKDYVSNEIKNELWNKGWLTSYKNHTVIVFDQSYEDTANLVKTFNPAYAYIIPTGAEKPVKLAFEGDTIMREVENHDWSKEMQIYKKFGVGVHVDNNLFVYHDTALD